jgi:hypothetical protein
LKSSILRTALAGTTLTLVGALSSCATAPSHQRADDLSNVAPQALAFHQAVAAAVAKTAATTAAKAAAAKAATTTATKAAATTATRAAATTAAKAAAPTAATAAATTAKPPVTAPVKTTVTTGTATTATVPSGAEAGAPAAGPFGPGSVWRASIFAAPLATNSAVLVADLASQVATRYGGIAAFNVWQYNTSFYTAVASTPIADVGWDNCQGKTYVPVGLVGPGGQFSAVPIPANAIPAAGADAELTVYSPATDQLWEFWKASHRADGWHACWGGRIDHVSTSPGFFTGGFGASASGLAVAGGMVSIADVRHGSIDHAMVLAVTDAAPWRIVSWPAQRSDGSASSLSLIAEGTRFRLDPSINVDALPMTPVAKMIAKAAQKYGFIVTDKAGAVSVVAESGAGIQAATGVNPWTAIMGSTPSYLMMRNFPWDKLQALPQNYGKP